MNKIIAAMLLAISVQTNAHQGFGPTQPIASNETVEGRAQNRRVVAEITVETEITK